MVVAVGKVGRRLRIIHAPRRIGSFKISRPEYYRNWLSSRKKFGGRNDRSLFFKQSAIVSIVHSFVFGNLKGQQGFLLGRVGG